MDRHRAGIDRAAKDLHGNIPPGSKHLGYIQCSGEDGQLERRIQLFCERIYRTSGEKHYGLIPLHQPLRSTSDPAFRIVIDIDFIQSGPLPGNRVLGHCRTMYPEKEAFLLHRPEIRPDGSLGHIQGLCKVRNLDISFKIDLIKDNLFPLY